MILQKWNEALIDWVNCLSLTGRISDIEELKNGEFFRLLLKKLTASEGVVECASDSFADIYSVLEKEFPLYGVCEIGRDDSRLSYIASLLLLLSVTKEETPMFQSNLCENLSHDSQVKIKCFLESCLESTNELNHSYLKTVIEGDDVSYDQTSAKVKDNVPIKTPMKDFFDSPRQTNKLKRDLKRLETENETLLLDKLELEDELRIEKEKRQRIEDLLSQKTEQVLKLREELQDFIQNSSIRANEEDNSSQSMSAIKCELRELEIYVTALQEEKTALFEEKEKLQEKISILQSKSKDLELQTVYSETKQQELLALLHKRDEEVSSLKEHCAELEEKINALPSALNMSIESDTSLPLGTISSPFGGERLSHAVVDVKLAEVEEENKKFKDQVKLLNDEREILIGQLKELQETLVKEKEEGKCSRLKIESLVIDLEAVKESNSFKEKSLLELEIKLNEKESLIQSLEGARGEIMAEKKLLESNILLLNNNIKILEETKGEILRNNSDYKIQLLELSGKLSALEMHLESKEKNLLNLKEELEGTNLLAENMRQDIQKNKEVIELMKEMNDSMKDTISSKDKHIEELIEKINSKDDSIRKIESNVCTKEKLIEELENKLQQKKNFIHSLESSHEVLETEKKQLENELGRINSQLLEKDSVIEKANLEKIEYTEKSEKMMEELKVAKDSCVLKENALLELRHQLRECKDKIKSLEELKEAMFAEKKELESSLHSLKANVKLLEEANGEMTKENSLSKSQLMDLSGKLTELERNLDMKERHLLTLREELAARDILDESMRQEIQNQKEEIERMKEISNSMKDTIPIKERECKELMEKISRKDDLIGNFEKDVCAKEKVIEELGEELREKTDLIYSLESIREALEVEREKLKSELGQINSQLLEKDSVIEKASMEKIEYRQKSEKMIEELKVAKDSCDLKENALLELKHQLCECKDKIKSLEELEATMFEEKKELESSILSLKAQVKLMEETKEEILKECSHYKSLALESGSKYSNLEIQVVELERNVKNLTEELLRKNDLVNSIKAEVKNCQDEMERMKEERRSFEESIALHEKANSELKENIFKMEATINSLEEAEKVLMTEKKELLCLVTEQRKTIDVLQQSVQSLNEEKILLENELSRWKAQSEAFKEMLKVVKIHGSAEKVDLVDNEDGVKCTVVSKSIENESEHATLPENASSELEAVGSNFKDSVTQTSSVYREKNGIFNGDFESFFPENIGCLLDRSGYEEKLGQLDIGKLMQLINSWHDIDISMEKLRAEEDLLKAKICSLWESIPRIQSKLKGNLSTLGTSQISLKETNQAKEVIMRIISMVRSLEKCNSSLEKELMHASSNALSWGLQELQNQFNVVTSTPNPVLSVGDLNLEGEHKNAFSHFLVSFRDKVSQVLEDVNSSEDIFKEVENRSANVAEALEYLKKNCLYEKELLSDVDYEGFQIALTEEESRERFTKAMDEMERAKEDLERIALESRKEIEILQNEKEKLEQELQSMAAHCSVLESKLKSSQKDIELAVQETQQKVQKIFEKKLEDTKEKWKSIYMDDLKNYEEEYKLRKQFEDSFKKYRSLAEDYEKRLAQATAQSADLKTKVENLKYQKSCLEMKLRESSARNCMEDEHRDSLDSACKSNFTDLMANYFASKNISSSPHSAYDSHREVNQDSISRSFSRESVQSSLPSGQVFCAEDEEGEWFNATYLNDLSEGKCIVPSSRASNAESCFGVLRESNKQRTRNPSSNEDTPNRRMKELMRRNTLCLPHLKSSYPTETQFHDPKNFPEELLKGSEQGSEQGKIPSTPGRFRSWFVRGKKTAPNSDVEVRRHDKECDGQVTKLSWSWSCLLPFFTVIFVSFFLHMDLLIDLLYTCN